MRSSRTNFLLLFSLAALTAQADPFRVPFDDEMRHFKLDSAFVAQFEKAEPNRFDRRFSQARAGESNYRVFGWATDYAFNLVFIADSESEAAYPGGEVSLKFSTNYKKQTPVNTYELHYDLSIRQPETPRAPWVTGAMVGHERREEPKARLTSAPFASARYDFGTIAGAAKANYNKTKNGWLLHFEVPWWFFGGKTPWHTGGSATWPCKLMRDDVKWEADGLRWPAGGPDRKLKLLSAELAYGHDFGEIYGSDQWKVRDTWSFAYSDRFFFFFQPKKDNFAIGSLESELTFLEARILPFLKENENLCKQIVPKKKGGNLPLFSLPEIPRNQAVDRLPALRQVRTEAEYLRRDYLMDCLMGREVKRPEKPKETKANKLTQGMLDDPNIMDSLGDDTGLELDEAAF